MASRLVRRLILLAGVGLAVTGCQPADDAPATPPPPVEKVAAPPTDEAGPVDDSATAPVPEAEAVATPPPVARDHFTPPFPDRTDPFEPPKRAEGLVRRGDNPGETVELKGFVNVDGPRVVLAIDGIISPLPVGGEKYGVRVIAIQPPSVVLQRGRSRWTASLE